MKTISLLLILVVDTGLGSSSSGQDDPDHIWRAPQEGEDRGPCPMLNTLANHNYIPRDGKLLTEENVSDGLLKALNFDRPFGAFLFSLGLQVNPEPNATWFSLKQLRKHNLIEHDASLSRRDAYFGNNWIFDPDVFDDTKEYWPSETLNAQSMANSKLARQIESRAFNPNYTFPTTTNEASLLELAAPICAFGDPNAGTVDKRLVEYFFENERLPTELGWVARKKALTEADMLRVGQMIRDATNLTTH